MAKEIQVGCIPVKRAEELVNRYGYKGERIVYDVPGHDVEITRYNRDSGAVLVSVDGRTEEMPLSQADGFIRSRI